MKEKIDVSGLLRCPYDETGNMSGGILSMLMYKYPAGVVETGTPPQMKIHLVTCQEACEQERLGLSKISSAILVTLHLS